MITAVDTNVLLDVLIPGAPSAGDSKARLDRAVGEGALVICEVVYAELCAHFPSRSGLDEFLGNTGIRLAASDRAALDRASRAWKSYLKRRRRRGQRCAQCDRKLLVQCPGCAALPNWRQHLIADFMIGGHATACAHRLLTRDRGYYRTYFEDLAQL